jgi:hypothetical protein
MGGGTVDQDDSCLATPTGLVAESRGKLQAAGAASYDYDGLHGLPPVLAKDATIG